MSFVTVKVNTNPIPATVLAPKPFAYPSGGGGTGGGSGATVVIAPHNPINAYGSVFAGATIHGNWSQVGSLPVAILGSRLTDGYCLFNTPGFVPPPNQPSPNPDYQISIHQIVEEYEFVVALDGPPGPGSLCQSLWSLPATFAGSNIKRSIMVPFTADSQPIAPGAHTLDIWVRNTSVYTYLVSPTRGTPPPLNPPVPIAPIVNATFIGAISGQIVYKEMDTVNL